MVRAILLALALSSSGCIVVFEAAAPGDADGGLVPAPDCPVPEAGAPACEAAQQAICDGHDAPYCIPPGVVGASAICCKLVTP